MKKLILIFLVLCCVQKINAQQNGKVFSLKEDEELQEIKESENFVVVSTGDLITGKDNVFVFDSRGNIQLTFLRFNRDVLLASPIESHNILLVVLMGDGYSDDPLERNNLLRAYDIKSGVIKWEVILNADTYEISQDENYVLTNGIAEAESVMDSPFTIVDLSNGSKKNTPINFINCYTRWLNNDEIAIIVNQMEETKEYQAWLKKVEERKKQYKAIDAEREDLHKRLKNKTITEEEFKKKLAINNDKYDKLVEEGRQHRYTRIDQYQYKAAKLLIYNLTENRIKAENDIYNDKGEGIYVNQLSLSNLDGRILKDMNNDIYFVGWEIGASKKIEEKIIKISTTNGHILWSKGLVNELSAEMDHIIYQDNPYFRIKKNNELFLLDNSEGTLVPASKYEDDVAFYNLILGTRRQKVVDSKRIKLSENDKEIVFPSIEEEVK